MTTLSDIEIARQNSMVQIEDVAKKLNLTEESLQKFGHHIAKIDTTKLKDLDKAENGKLILVTAISPTPAGEGKTTTSVGLNDALNKIGKQSIVCLREPSLGPCFGVKGGAAGGGYAQVVPMEKINLHFTGDFHAITSAHNLLSSLIDNHIYWGNKLEIDVRRIVWGRVVDLNDRSLRAVNVNLGGVANGFPREEKFDITVASEVMAIFCLSTSLEDLQNRLGKIIIGYTRDRKEIRARELNADGAMTTLLKDAFLPNLVQTLEKNPAIIHGGPFANIAHGCNSLIATQTALKLSDYVVTEAGFGADLGAEKFLDIKCRKGDLKPSAIVLVATVRALKMHGGVDKKELKGENVEAVKKGLANLEQHIANIKKFNVPVSVAINHFSLDTESELKVVEECCKNLGVKAFNCKHWADGGAGATDLAEHVASVAESGEADLKHLYSSETTLWEKMRTIATEIYGADDIIADQKIKSQFDELQKDYGSYPICVAKTQYSFSTDPNLRGAPKGHVVPIREIRLAAGAEFLVVVCDKIMTMPGLPRVPAADAIHLNKDGEIEGLF
ncbi:MAG: formate--tetrahydrofolate ligase [Pelagibacterales bacterium]|nr:formate--tetrahydrofolate ligase [Pelagibacterales bacterium]